MLAADKASAESLHPIGSSRQCCAVNVAGIGSLLPGVRPAGSCSPVTTAGAPGMPCAGAARGPAGPGHGGGGRRAQVGGAGRRCQGLARGCRLVGAVAAVGLGGLSGDTEVLWGGERGGREAMGDASCAVEQEVLVRTREAVGVCRPGGALGMGGSGGNAAGLEGPGCCGAGRRGCQGAGCGGAVGVGSL